MSVVSIRQYWPRGREREAAERLLERYRKVTAYSVRRAFPDLPPWASVALVAYHQSRVPLLEHALDQDDGARLRQLIDEAVEDQAFPPHDFGEVGTSRWGWPWRKIRAR